jgi:predicted RNase H-like HicB family nuclease
MKYLIEIFWSDEDEGYIATIPDLPGCSAWGNTPIEALQQIRERS